jgi:DNA-binding LytR/AlgR family response regulator
MAIVCLVIEDDKSVVDLILNVGNDFDQTSFNYVGEEQETALNMILEIKPKIIFINIESVKINFLEFFYEISQYVKDMPKLIALATTKESAYDAFQYNFSLYLLKPLTEYTIRKNLLSILEKIPTKKAESLCLKSNKDFHYLDISNILYLKADNNTTDFFMNDGRVINSYKTLKVFEQSLPENFYRIHKSYIINIDSISRVHFGKSMCIIKNQHKIPFTKTFIDNINTMNKVLSDSAMFTLK